MGLRKQQKSHLKLLESASDLIDCTEFNDEESEGESDNDSVMTNIGSIYDEYDDFYDDMDCIITT